MAFISRHKAWIARLSAILALAIFAIFLYLSVRSVLGQFSLQSLHLAPIAFASLLPLAIWSFSLRAVRLHVLLRRVVPNLPFSLTLRTQAIGFALAVSPGRLGEFYKLQAVQQATGTPVAKSLPAVLAERLTDLSAFAALTIFGAWLSWSSVDSANRAATWLVLGLVLILGAFLYQLVARHALDRSKLTVLVRSWRDRAVSRFPILARPFGLVRQLWSGSLQLASPKTLALALAAVLIARVADVLVIYLLARSLGFPISFPIACLMLGLTGLAGGISLAPGGMGAAEAALTALAIAQGIPLDSALSIALITRTLTFWLWVVLGLLVFSLSLLSSHRHRLPSLATPGSSRHNKP